MTAEHTTPSDDPIAEIARAAAHRVAPTMARAVEVELASRERHRRPERYVDPISLGGLIVATATLAWNVYQDLKTKTPKPPRDTMARTVRVTLRNTDSHSPAEQDHIIDIVIDETLRAAEKS